MQTNTPHRFFNKNDFTSDEYNRHNVLAMAVIDKHQKICKKCGYHKTVDVIMDTCEEVRKERQFRLTERIKRDRLERSVI